VTSAILIVIALSLLYWVAVVVVEMYVLLGEQRERERVVSASKIAKGGKGGSRGKGGKAAAAGDSDEDDAEAKKRGASVNLGPIDTENNPLFFTSGDASSANPLSQGLDLDAVRSMTAAPSQVVWEWMQVGFAETASQISSLEEERARLQAALSRGGAVAAAAAGGAPAAGPRRTTSFSKSPRAGAPRNV
jgi:hypothetical protein